MCSIFLNKNTSKTSITSNSVALPSARTSFLLHRRLTIPATSVSAYLNLVFLGSTVDVLAKCRPTMAFECKHQILRERALKSPAKRSFCTKLYSIGMTRLGVGAIHHGNGTKWQRAYLQLNPLALGGYGVPISRDANSLSRAAISSSPISARYVGMALSRKGEPKRTRS